MDIRAAINLIESQGLSGLAAVTPEQVIAYCRSPQNPDVYVVYDEQIDFAFDGNRDALDAWITDMIDHVRPKIAEMVTNRTYMFRGFQTKPNEPLGVHWTTNKAVAEMFAQGGTVLTAYIDPNIIDWLGTIVRGIFWDNDREDELFLLHHSEVRLIGGERREV